MKLIKKDLHTFRIKNSLLTFINTETKGNLQNNYDKIFKLINNLIQDESENYELIIEVRHYMAEDEFILDFKHSEGNPIYSQEFNRFYGI